MTSNRSKARARLAGSRSALVVGALAMVGGAAVFLVGPSAGAASKISVTQTPLVPVSTCTSAADSLSYTTLSDGSIFRLRVRAAAPLCDPITATAVIYAMPTDGSVWPQTLSESASFTISGASVTDIVFTKDCTPAQFDVVTGATPQTISPLGERHGPLLIPDTGTAYQDPGAVCSPVTSTTAPASSTTSPNTTAPAASTTVANTSVANTTTTTAAVVAGVNTTPSTSPPSVLDTSSTRPSGSAGSNSPSSLAVTGVSSRATALMGAGLFIAGFGLIIASRRRFVPAVRMITSSASVSPNSPFGLD